ncbi:MAG: RtcB family protein [Conexivisphaera sp.]
MSADNVRLRRVDSHVWEIPREAREDMRVPVRIYASEALLGKMREDRTLLQAMNVSTIKGIQKWAIVLPDAHEGYGFPVGGVAAMDAEEGAVSPGGVGYDINCGVRLLRTNLSVEDVKPKIRELLDQIFKLVPSGVGSEGIVRVSTRELDEVAELGMEWAVEHGYGWKRDLEHAEEGGRIRWADPSKVSETAKRRGAEQLGTLGSGNHFLELEVVDRVMDEAAARAMGIRPGQVMVLIHTGSRGFGHQICSDYLRVMERVIAREGIRLPDRELAYGPVRTEEVQNYLGAMASAANFAWANRQMITHWVREAFSRVYGRDAESLGLELVYDVAHNIVKLEEHVVDGERRKVYVHRKGATRSFPPGSNQIPADYREIGQPVLIPGSMGTGSWVMVGVHTSMELSFGSAAHGAGRFMSRAAAKRKHRYRDLLDALERGGVLVKASSVDTVVEEAPDAYKDVDAVADATHAAGLAKKVARLRPLGVVKG